MRLYEHKLYREDVEHTARKSLPWEKLAGGSILISGATGQIGSFLVDVIAWRNMHNGQDCTLYALGRSESKARERFEEFYGMDWFRFIPCDINEPLVGTGIEKTDYVLHLASNTHPLQYSTDPIGTITTNILGVKNMLDFCAEHQAKRFAFASSNEVYGENRGDVEFFDEDYCGYINCNTLRAGYPESKRCGEALCQAYIRQKGLNVVIPRLTRSYGPTLLKTDTKAMSQFLGKALAGEDIILKSAGTQYYSYTYIADAVSGLLTVLLLGETGEAYNIADERSDIMLKDLAAVIAGAVDRKVVFEIPDQVEAAGYSKATKARLDSTKLQKLGWKADFDIKEGVAHTLAVMRDCKQIE